MSMSMSMLAVCPWCVVGPYSCMPYAARLAGSHTAVILHQFVYLEIVKNRYKNRYKPLQTVTKFSPPTAAREK